MVLPSPTLHGLAEGDGERDARGSDAFLWFVGTPPGQDHWDTELPEKIIAAPPPSFPARFSLHNPCSRRSVFPVFSSRLRHETVSDQVGVGQRR